MRDLLAWVRKESWDWAKAGAVLYAGGLLISSIYFLRFSILSLDLLRPQSLLVGLYFVFLYFILPAMFLMVLRSLQSISAILIVFLMLLAAKELVLRLLIAAPPAAAIVLLVISQLILFCRASRNRKSPAGISLRFEVIPKDALAALALGVILFTFSTTLYGSIPGYLGGGKPILVNVFTKTAELPGNRFMQTRNAPQINKAMPSFRLRLLYESSDYLYFVAETRGKINGYSIMRLKRDEVLRMDYITPVWFTFN